MDDSIKPVVLLVDDNKELRDAGRTFFECHGFRTDSASTVDSALRVFHHHTNDLMVGYVDIHMDDEKAGFDIIQYGHEVVPNRVVLYGWTGDTSLATEERIAKAGGHGVIIKGQDDCGKWDFERMLIWAKYPNALKLVRKASYDFLTNLRNRSAFEDEVLVALAEAKTRRKAHTLCMVLMDMNGFKRINDRWGHLDGDKCLIQVAEIIKNEMRPSDITARWGGDEFVAVMPGVSLEDTQKKALAIMRAVEDSPVRGSNGLDIPISITCGVAELNRRQIGYPLEAQFLEWMARADQAMYHKKPRRKRR